MRAVFLICLMAVCGCGGKQEEQPLGGGRARLKDPGALDAFESCRVPPEDACSAGNSCVVLALEDGDTRRCLPNAEAACGLLECGEERSCMMQLTSPPTVFCALAE